MEQQANRYVKIAQDEAYDSWKQLKKRIWFILISCTNGHSLLASFDITVIDSTL